MLEHEQNILLCQVLLEVSDNLENENLFKKSHLVIQYEPPKMDQYEQLQKL